jgi:hypothetical protein
MTTSHQHIWPRPSVAHMEAKVTRMVCSSVVVSRTGTEPPQVGSSADSSNERAKPSNASMSTSGGHTLHNRFMSYSGSAAKLPFSMPSMMELSLSGSCRSSARQAGGGRAAEAQGPSRCMVKGSRSDAISNGDGTGMAGAAACRWAAEAIAPMVRRAERSMDRWLGMMTVVFLRWGQWGKRLGLHTNTNPRVTASEGLDEPRVAVRASSVGEEEAHLPCSRGFKVAMWMPRSRCD